MGTPVYKKVTSYNGVTTAYGAIVAKYNKAVTANTSATYVVIDNNGASVTSPFGTPTMNPNDSTELILPLNAAVATGITSYTVIMPSGAVKDTSIAGNTSAASNVVVDVSAGVPTASDTAAPTVASVTYAPATSATSGSTITVTFNEAVSGLDPVTVLNTNNYRLDGAPLPTGSYIALSGTVATITIPAGSIATDKMYPTGYVFNITGIKDKAANVMAPYVGNVTLNDDIAPVMTSAAINSSDGSLSIGFSESPSTPVANSVYDFQVTLNGTTLANSGVNVPYTITAGTGADFGKYVLSVKQSVQGIAATNSSVTIGTQTYTVTGATAIKFTFIDANGDGQLTSGGGDIILSYQGDTATTAFAANGTYNLTNSSTLSIATILSPQNVTDTSSLHNKLKGATSITVK